MRLVRQPNKWSCAAASLAMLADVTYEEVIKAIGHDGSEQWWRDETRAFSIPEIVDTAANVYGIALVQFDVRPAICHSTRHDEEREIYPDCWEKRLHCLMNQHPGLLVGYYAIDKFHMVAWDGQQIYDPRGTTYQLGDSDSIIVDRFFMALRCEPLKRLLFGIKS